MRSKVFLLWVLLMCGVGGRAQNVEYTAALDTNYIMIGDQVHFRMKALAGKETRVRFPLLSDTLVRGIEIVSGPERDSIVENDGRILYEESYVVTSFDTGVYVVPAMAIELVRADYNSVVRTDPLRLIVNTFVVDTQKGYMDIVMPKNAPWTFREILPYVLWGLLGAVVIALIGWLVLKRKRHEGIFVQVKPTIPPYDLAIKALDEIKQEKLWQSGKVKEYYTRLTDAVRGYLSGELNIAAMEQTSMETLQDLKQCEHVTDKQREQLADMFETADFVKFAKAEPLPDENARNLELAYSFVNETNEVMKELAEKVRQEEEAKKRLMQEEQKASGQEAMKDAKNE